MFHSIPYSVSLFSCPSPFSSPSPTPHTGFIFHVLLVYLLSSQRLFATCVFPPLCPFSNSSLVLVIGLSFLFHPPVRCRSPTSLSLIFSLCTKSILSFLLAFAFSGGDSGVRWYVLFSSVVVVPFFYCHHFHCVASTVFFHSKRRMRFMPWILPVCTRVWE